MRYLVVALWAQELLFIGFQKMGMRYMYVC